MTQQALATAPAGRKSLQLRAQCGGRPKLLLAEDSDPVRIVTAAMLKGMGCDVEAVVHGEQALRSAEESRFDVIVLDIEMPIMDGITAARSIRRLARPASTTPLMALSAFLADSVRTGDWRDTFDIALPKPTNRAELHDAVQTALNRNQPGEADAADHPPVIDAEQFAALRTGIAGPIWEQLSDVACRDIEVCINQLDHAAGIHDGAAIIFATKLANLGRTFAAPRLALAAQQVQLAPSDAVRAQAVAQLMSVARSTVAALRR